MKTGMVSDASCHSCWGVISALGRCSLGQGFLFSQDFGGPEGFQPGVGAGLEN